MVKQCQWDLDDHRVSNLRLPRLYRCLKGGTLQTSIEMYLSYRRVRMEIDREAVDLFPVNLALLDCLEQHHLYPYPEHVLEFYAASIRLATPRPNAESFRRA